MENEKSTKQVIQDMKKNGKSKKIRESLLQELERNGNKKAYYSDLVEDYISLWTTKELLKRDIEERGVRVLYENGPNQRGFRKNESVDQIVKINAQMLKLLTELGISPSMGFDGGEDDEL